MSAQNPPVVELERRLKWRVWPTLLFLVNMVALLSLAIASLVVPPRHPRGLPAGDDVRLAAAALSGRVPVMRDGLRFRAAVLAGEPADRAADSTALVLARIIRPLLDKARRDEPRDPRVHAALAALDLAARDWARAAGRYRTACELAPHYGEARLGLGVTLALEAGVTEELWPRRALQLQAIAQFAAVDHGEPEYTAALFDRARLLLEVGREREAQVFATRFLALEPAGPYAEWLRAALRAEH